MARNSHLIDDRYFALVRRFPLKSIQSEKELDGARAIINELVDQGFDSLSAGEDAYLDVLSDLVEKYENMRHPIAGADPAEVLQMLLDDRGLSQRTVAIESGIAVSTMSQIVAGRRQMNLEHIKRLALFFQVPASVFLPETGGPPMARGRVNEK